MTCPDALATVSWWKDFWIVMLALSWLGAVCLWAMLTELRQRIAGLRAEVNLAQRRLDNAAVQLARAEGRVSQASP